MGKYRMVYDEPNTNCSDCSKSIWASMDIDTLYHGKEYLNSKHPESVVIYEDNSCRVVCPECFVKYSKAV